MFEEKDNEMYGYLKDDNVEVFNKEREAGKFVGLVNAKFRSFDLRGANLNGLDLSGVYFKNSDLRGVDLSKSKLAGASIYNAKISGVLFPSHFSAEEITMSLLYGTRLRVTK
ncbi:MAG: hypothetical protein COB26_02460 [Piscirickettsiaceae bacterium]|nr:MAG: hypothetical protein COB89_00035 [Piscirickettsiaceae bacterium]PCI70945.1 MAG: hypothetical protein COB26_02460 [Piscirickettsiaceae bacterium]